MRVCGYPRASPSACGHPRGVGMSRPAALSTIRGQTERGRSGPEGAWNNEDREFGGLGTQRSCGRGLHALGANVSLVPQTPPPVQWGVIRRQLKHPSVNIFSSLLRISFTIPHPPVNFHSGPWSQVEPCAQTEAAKGAGKANVTFSPFAMKEAMKSREWKMRWLSGR